MILQGVQYTIFEIIVALRRITLRRIMIVIRQIKIMIRKSIEQQRNRWILKVIFTFFVVVGILIGIDKITRLYSLSDMYMRVAFMTLGLVYLFQIFSYRKIKCPNCNAQIFNQFNIWFSLQKQCKKCQTTIY